jgi:zinc transporter 1/2/3
MSAPWTIEVECGGGNQFDGRMGVRISSIFVIGFGSMLGALSPIVAARSSHMRVPQVAFFIAKYFGSGVIIATAFIHLLAPAQEALGSPCLEGPITEYPWVEGISLMTIFTMFIIELMASRFDMFGGHDHDDIEAHGHDHDAVHKHQGTELQGQSSRHVVQLAQADPSLESPNHPTHAHPEISHTVEAAIVHTTRKASSSESEHESESSSSIANNTTSPYTDEPHTKTHPIPTERLAPITSHLSRQASNYPVRTDEVSYPPGGMDHLGHQRIHSDDNEYFAAQLTAIFILEFGVIFHSIFIGLTLAVAGEEFIVLYIVLVFHQTFEGLGLGSRLGTMQWPKKKSWWPWALGIAYGLTTPIAIAVGLGVRESFVPGEPKTMIINGVFDSVSAGILIYTGLVELMAHEFMFNQEMRRGSGWGVAKALGWMMLGAGLMALLGKWA